MASAAAPKPKAKPPPAAVQPAKLPPCGFLVSATKKGGLPVSVEKRPKGKKVTIISNIQGSAASLLSALSSLLGCGGTKRQEASGIHWTVEIQGDQSERVLAALTQLGCLKGIKKEEESKQEKKQMEVATRQCAYDKFLRRGDEDKKHELLADFRQGTLLPGAECSKWHGPWLYCRGCCERTVMDDVWEEGLGTEEEDRTNAAPVAAPSSTAELNLALRSLGMLAEVGFVARGGLSKNPAASGLSLADYKRQAVGPGARLIDDEPEPGAIRGAAARRAASRAKSKPRGAMARTKSCEPELRVGGRSTAATRKPPPSTAKQGIYRCLICGCTFGLQKTLRLHVRNSHPSASGRTFASAAPDAPTQSRWSASTAARPARSSSSALTRAPAGPTPWSSPPDSPRHLPASSPTPAASSRAPAPAAVPAPGARAATSQPRSSRPSRTSTARGAPSEDFAECPLCFKVMRAGEALEAHVEACCARAEREAADACAGSAGEQSPENDSWQEAAGGPYGGAASGERHQDEDGSTNELRLVRVSYAPKGESQIAIQEGEAVRVTWVQPPKDGGYWAYVIRAGHEADEGYVPVNSLDGAGGDDEDFGVVPESWLHCLLQLDLMPGPARLFWKSFQDLSRNVSMSQAWLHSLSLVCNSMAAPASGVLLEQPAPAGPRDSEHAPPASHHRGVAGSREEAALAPQSRSSGRGYPQAASQPPPREDLQRWAAQEAEQQAQQAELDARAERRARRAEARQQALAPAALPGGSASSGQPRHGSRGAGQDSPPEADDSAAAATASAARRRATSGGQAPREELDARAGRRAKKAETGSTSEQSAQLGVPAFAIHSSHAGRTAAQWAPRQLTDAAVAAPAAAAEATAGSEQQGRQEHIWTATKAFTPAGPDADSCIELRVGDKVSVSWQQPKAEGGHWAYGLALRSKREGYFPISHARSQLPEEVGGCAGATAASGAKAAPEAGRPAGSAPAAAAGGPRGPAPVAVVAWEAADATVSSWSQPVAVSADAGAGRLCSSDAQAAAPRLPGGAAATAATMGNSWRQRRAVAKAKQPGGGEGPGGDGLECAQLASMAPDGRAGVGPQLVAAPVAAADAGAGAGWAVEQPLANFVEPWAHKKLADILQRFCTHQRLDPAVVYSSLIVSRSAAEMREEAKAMIADNKVVDNFVAELWRKRADSTGPRACAA